MSEERKIIRLHTISKDESQTHYHQQIELFYLLGGSVDVRIDDQTYPMSADDFLIVNANKTHSFLNAHEIVAARFEIDYNMLAEMLGMTQLFFWCNTVVDRNEAYDRCRDILDRILIESYEREQVNELQLHAYYYQLLTVLTGNFLISQNERAPGSGDSRDSDRMQRIRNYIQSNYQSQISLNDLARKLYLSNAYLSKYIKRNFGVTFVEYLNDIRMFHAVDELMYTDKNLTHIALDNGFPTSASFNRAFKDAYHVTPSEYRKKAQHEMNVASETSEESSHSAEEIRTILRQKEHLNPHTEGVVESRIDANAVVYDEEVTRRGINIRDAQILLVSEVQKHLLDLRDECGLDYVRLRLNSDKNRTLASGDILNHHTVNLILDFLTENIIDPSIVVEFTGNLSCDLARENILDMVNRYGPDRVENWSIEFTTWSETESAETAEAFCCCFINSYRIIKKILPDIRLGIGGFVLGHDNSRITSILSVLGREDICPDFLAFSSFQKISFAEVDNFFIRSSTDGNYLYNQMQLIRKRMKKNGCSVKALHVSEWNHTTSRNNPFNDSCEQAAYVLKNLIAMKGQAANMAYWHVMDTNDRSRGYGRILNGDSGVITRDGIRKPSFYAMSFFNRLMPYEVQRDEHGIVTTNRRDHYVIACHNYKTMLYANAGIREEEISPDNLANYLGNNEYLRLKYCLENVRSGSYLARIYYINQSNGSVQDMWKKMGWCTELARDEIEHLRLSAHPTMEIRNIEVKDGTLEIESELAPQEIRLIDIQLKYK